MENKYKEFLQSETNKLKILLYIEANGLPEEEEDRLTLLTLLNKKGGYPVKYMDLIEWMPIINDYWSLDFIEKVASEIKKPILWQQEIKLREDLTKEQKALMFFALPL